MNNKKSLPIETSDTLNASRNGKEKWSIREKIFDVTTLLSLRGKGSFPHYWFSLSGFSQAHTRSSEHGFTCDLLIENRYEEIDIRRIGARTAGGM